MAFMLEHNTAAHKFFSAVALTPRRANHGVHPSLRARDGAVARCFLYSQRVSLVLIGVRLICRMPPYALPVMAARGAAGGGKQQCTWNQCNWYHMHIVSSRFWRASANRPTG